MRRRTTLGLLLAAGAASLTGCAGYYYGENHGPTLGSMVRGNLVQASHGAADRLLQDAMLDPRQPVLVGT
ncbi:MAG: hypothetical protein RBS27_07810, partial [Giesbergeria sp.]|nr:hypothetical protein [Giesbergeria sp.]